MLEYVPKRIRIYLQQLQDGDHQAGQWEGPGVAEQIIEIRDVIDSHNKYCGIMATDTENLSQRKDQGFRILGIGSDAALLLSTTREILNTVGQDKKPSLDPRA